jgi:FKBP-type peptidyl-prolyl cis-trans isomerase (trigger factor)
MNVKVDVKKEEAWRRVLAIEVPEDDVAKEYDRVAQKVAKRGCVSRVFGRARSR